MVHNKIWRLVHLALALGLLAACTPAARTAPEQVPGPAMPLPEPSTPTMDPLKRHPFVPDPGVFHYRVEQRTIIAISQDSVAGRTDTLFAAASLHYEFQRRDSGSGDTVLAVVDSLTIRSGSDMASELGVDQPVRLDIVRNPREESPDLAGMAVPAGERIQEACDQPDEVARTLARDLLVLLPDTIEAGQTWVDSSRTTVCRGTIPLAIETVATYRVEGIQEAPDGISARIVRTARSVISGSRLFGTRPIAVQGAGLSETLFTFGVSPGVLLGATGRSVLELTFQAPYGVESVRQAVQTRLTASPR